MEATAAPAPRPTSFREIFSLTKPGITALIVLVAVAGFFVAEPSPVPYARLAILVLTGAAASAGAAMLNHYFDRDLDGRMRRTRGRPLPTQRVASESSVLAVGLLLSAAGIVGAGIFLNPLTGFSILLGGFTYVVVYTIWLKRRSSWNIVIGGFAGSAPALAGSAAAVGSWTTGSLALALLVFLWTPPHFWSLALLIRDDYRKVGLPMLPNMDDPARSGRIVVLACALLLPATALLLWFGPVTLPAAIILAGAGAAFLYATLPLYRQVTPRAARRGFLASGPDLLAIIVGVVLNAVLASSGLPMLR
jgi:protoheme IX farnesyltransferase